MIAILHEGNAKKTADNKLIKRLIENLNLNENKVRFFDVLKQKLKNLFEENQ